MSHIRFIVIISIMLLSGCVGVGLQVVYHNDSETQYMPQNSIKKEEWEEYANIKYGKILDSEVDGEKEIWTVYYQEWFLGANRKKLKWHGIVLWLIAPVPLMIPTYDKSVYEFNNEILVREKHFSSKTNGFFIGCMAGVEFFSGKSVVDCAAEAE